MSKHGNMFKNSEEDYTVARLVVVVKFAEYVVHQGYTRGEKIDRDTKWWQDEAWRVQGELSDEYIDDEITKQQVMQHMRSQQQF